MGQLSLCRCVLPTASRKREQHSNVYGFMGWFIAVVTLCNRLQLTAMHAAVMINYGSRHAMWVIRRIRIKLQNVLPAVLFSGIGALLPSNLSYSE